MCRAINMPVKIIACIIHITKRCIDFTVNKKTADLYDI